MPDDMPDTGVINAVIHARHGDPFAVLGPHPVPSGTAIRAFIPNADSVAVVARATGLELGTLSRVDAAGFWTGVIASDEPYLFRIASPSGERETEDAYSFPPMLGDIDIYLLGEGRHRDFARVLGAHVALIDDVSGVRFAVWAPNARRVSVVGSFNGWDGRCHPMRLRHGSGVWEIFVPRVAAGAIYKYELLGPDGAMLPLKADPVAQATERPPATGSVVADPAEAVWTDAEWLASRARNQGNRAPLSIYEVHAVSWLPNAETADYTWDDLADKLVPYVQHMGFTHVELLPIMEHPFGGSWGYQPLSQFAPTARLGPPAGFARFVDRCHRAGVGVILDWVPAHFPTDAHGLARFDGTPLYEHGDPREGFHNDWNTFIYNHGRHEVRAFLIGSALYWIEQFHVDAIRVDAVASMLYRDYSRESGEWVPNRYGGRENLEVIEFFHELSRALIDRAPGVVMIAEESTSFPMVSRPVAEGGLGFDYKWNMGWMHDTLNYMAEQPINRRWHHANITFGLVYAFSENFVLPISHDEVVYGKGSLIRKMPGDDWQRFSNLRAYLGFMWTHPGKKLLFMGCEIAQWREWNHDAGLDWFLLDKPEHKGIQKLVCDLNAIYRSLPALHARDSEPSGFRWVLMDEAEQSVYAFLRLGETTDKPVLVVCNFTPVPRHDFRLGVPTVGLWQEVVNTDAAIYGGSDLGNLGWVQAEPAPAHDQPASVVVSLPPLSTLVFCAA